MECIDPPDNPGEERVSSVVMPNQSEVDLEWEPVASCELDLDQKEGTPHLYFVTVEFVEGSPSEFVQTFSNFETDTSFSPQPSSSSEFEQHVSPLDPSMNSTTHYSPVYAVTQSPQATDCSTSNPPSPFQVGQPAPHSPYIDTAQSMEPVTTTPYVGNLPDNPQVLSALTKSTPSTSPDSKNLLQQVTMDRYFQQTHDSPPSTSDAQSQLTVSERFAVSTSASAAAVGFESAVTLATNRSSESVESSQELLIHASLNNTQLPSSQYHGVEPAAVVMSQPDIHVKTDGFSHIQLLISSGSGENIAYSIEGGHASSIQSVLESIKEHGLVIEGVDGVEDGDLKLLPEDPDLNMDTITLAINQQQSSLLDSSLLESHIREQMLRLGGEMQINNQIQIDDVQASIGGRDFKDTDKYADILLDEGMDMDLLSPSQEEQKLSDEIEKILIVRRSRRHQVREEDDSGSDKCEDCCDSLNMSCEQHEVQCISDKPVLSRALATLPPLLVINKVSALTLGSTACGVFARKLIPKRAQFGPVEGILDEVACSAIVEEESEVPTLQLLVESENGLLHQLDTSNEYKSNWMRFIRPARNAEEQNLIVTQQGHSLYFTTIRAIQPRQELLAWYSANYASKRNLPALESHCKNEEQTWPCFECNEKFLTSEELQVHLNVHDTEKNDSQLKMRSKSRKGKHLYRRKNSALFRSKKFKTGKLKDKRLHTCSRCQRVFLRSYSFRKHLELHSCIQEPSSKDRGEDFSGICRDRFMIRPYDDKRKHKVKYSLIKKHIERAMREWQCSHCNLKFDNPSVLNLHMLTHAAENLEEPETIMGLPSVFASMYHDEEFLSEDGDVFYCPQCTQEFPRKKELIEHVSEHGKIPGQDPPLQRRGFNPAKPWKCECCYKSFATEERLQRHMLVHGSEETKPLQCEICFKRFLNNSALACHIKIHTGKKVYECPICKNIFDQLIDLKEHVLIHSENGIYKCPQCKKVFDEYSLIRKHIRAFHCDRKHKCSYCPKQFPTLDKLKMHMLRHSDHREFLCANCGKQFKRKDKLKEHMNRMHTAEKDVKPVTKPSRSHLTKKFMPKISPNDYSRFIYKCHSCMVGFKRRGMLVNHLAKRHPEISPDSVPELNLPILKTTRDYYCQYCDKVYKSSSKRKAHILKNHPGSELPMSNRRKGGVPDIPGQPNPTYSQTVGSVTTHPHGCSWCHKQYASKAKLLQHQRKKHADLLSQAQQVSCSPCTPPSDTTKHQKQSKSPVTNLFEAQHRHIEVQLQGLETVNIIPEFQITATEEELQQYQESGIIIDASSLKQVKDFGEGVSVDLLSQAMSEFGQSIGEYRVALGAATTDHYFKIVHMSGQMTVAATEDDPDDPDPVSPMPAGLQPFLGASFSLPSSPHSWATAHPPYTPTLPADRQSVRCSSCGSAEKEAFFRSPLSAWLLFVGMMPCGWLLCGGATSVEG